MAVVLIGSGPTAAGYTAEREMNGMNATRFIGWRFNISEVYLTGGVNLFRDATPVGYDRPTRTNVRPRVTLISGRAVEVFGSAVLVELENPGAVLGIV